MKRIRASAVTPEESEEVQRGLPAVKEVSGRINTKNVEVSQECIFGEQVERVPVAPTSAGQSTSFAPATLGN